MSAQSDSPPLSAVQVGEYQCTRSIFDKRETYAAELMDAWVKLKILSVPPSVISRRVPAAVHVTSLFQRLLCFLGARTCNTLHATREL